MEYYKNTLLTDLPGERWQPFFGFENEYLISNLGRVKSLGRFITTAAGQERWVKEKILTQAVRYKGQGKAKRIYAVTVSIKRQNIPINKAVWQSFHPKNEIKPGEVIMRLDKNPLNNTLENLKKASRAASRAQDMENATRFKKAVKLNFKKAQDTRLEIIKNRSFKVCSYCGKKDSLDKFPEGRSMHQECIRKKEKETRKKEKSPN